MRGIAVAGLGLLVGLTAGPAMAAEHTVTSYSI
jgi:hypothetical protein